MKRIYLALLVLPILSACASSPVGPGLQALQGKNIRTAIDHLGYPDYEQEIVGDKVYTWSTREIVTDVYPVATHHGRRGGGYRYVPDTYTYSCTIKIITDQNDVIKTSQAASRSGGCSTYNRAFDRILEQYGPAPQLKGGV